MNIETVETAQQLIGWQRLQIAELVICDNEAFVTLRNGTQQAVLTMAYPDETAARPVWEQLEIWHALKTRLNVTETINGPRLTEAPAYSNGVPATRTLPQR